MEKFPEKLRILREQHGLSQRMLAEELGFTPAYIHFLETGKKKPNVELAIKLADLFGVSLDVLLRDERELDAGEGQ